MASAWRKRLGMIDSRQPPEFPFVGFVSRAGAPIQSGRPAVRSGGVNDKGARERAPLALSGAADRNRTGDLLITNQLLYRLSYSSEALHSNRGFRKAASLCVFQFSNQRHVLPGKRHRFDIKVVIGRRLNAWRGGVFVMVRRTNLVRKSLANTRNTLCFVRNRMAQLLLSLLRQ